MNARASVVALVLVMSCTPQVTDDPSGEGEGEGLTGEGEGETAGEGEREEGEGEGTEGEGEGEGTEGEGEGTEGEGEGEGTIVGDYGPYDSAGPLAFDVLELDVDDRNFTVLVFVPSTPGPHPVVSFSPGLQQRRDGYIAYGERLASHGIAMVIRDDPGIFTETPDVRDDVIHMITAWLPAANADPAHALFGKLDLERVGVTGHSRGGKTSLLVAEAHLSGVRAWFGVDPVETSTLAGGVYTLDDLPEVGIPLTFLFAEIAGNCSPVGTTATVLWPQAVAPAVMITALGAGHTQFEDPSNCLACAVCVDDAPLTADQSAVHAYSLRYFTAFFARHLLDDVDVGDAFEGAGVALDVAAGHVAIEAR